MKNLQISRSDRKAIGAMVLVIVVSALVAMMTSCSKEEAPASLHAGIRINGDSIPDLTTVTFSCGGFSMSQTSMARTRAALSDLQLTDLWLFDYIGDELQQTVHQQATDAGFGSIALTAEYGQHHLYFVASRGTEPTIDGITLKWSKSGDTFWHALDLDIQPSTAPQQSVVLSRVATRLRIVVTDEVPAELHTFAITPQTWYYGLNIRTGEAADGQTTPRSIVVPESYVGTSGQLAMSVYGIGKSEDYQTDVRLQALKADGTAIADITIPQVTMKRNVMTQYSGQLFGSAKAFGITADDDWGNDNTGTW